jgi:hypothetical protein
MRVLVQNCSNRLALGRASNGMMIIVLARVHKSIFFGWAGLLICSIAFVAIRAGSIRQFAAWNDNIEIPRGFIFFIPSRI